jgi:hypothetical protein
MEYCKGEMTKKLASRPDLAEKIIPKDFGPGCRRPTPAKGYLEALVTPNTTVYTDQLTEITEKGFIDNQGNEIEVDVIICATGFDTTYVPRFPIVANGKDLREVWAKDAVAYMGMAVPNYPNYFVAFGPYSPASGSFLVTIEYMLRYMSEIITKCQIENIKSIAPRMERTINYRDHCDLLLKRTVWTQNCRSWFKGGKIDGIPRMAPGSRTHFLELIARPRYEDYEMVYESINPFEFCGNGFSVRDSDGRDKTWYLGLVGGKDVQAVYPD